MARAARATPDAAARMGAGGRRAGVRRLDRGRRASGDRGESSGDDLRVSYFLAISQALALGPLIGFSQAAALRPYTQRWKWWIAANFVSWLAAQALFYVVSLILGGFDFAHGNGSPLEAYVVLLAATPLSGRWMLWVTAPDATVPVTEPGASVATAAAHAHPR